MGIARFIETVFESQKVAGQDEDNDDDDVQEDGDGDVEMANGDADGAGADGKKGKSNLLREIARAAGTNELQDAGEIKSRLL